MKNKNRAKFPKFSLFGATNGQRSFLAVLFGCLFVVGFCVVLLLLLLFICCFVLFVCFCCMVCFVFVFSHLKWSKNGSAFCGLLSRACDSRPIT